MNEDPQSGFKNLRRVAGGLVVVGALCAGYNLWPSSEEEGEDTAPKTSEHAPKTFPPVLTEGAEEAPLENRHEALAEAQRVFSEDLADCMEVNFEPGENVVSLECTVLPIEKSAFPGEGLNLKPNPALADFPSAYPYTTPREDTADLKGFSLNRVQCLGYDERDNLVAGVVSYAGPVIEQEPGAQWNEYSVLYGQIVTDDLNSFVFGRRDNRIPRASSGKPLVKRELEFEGVTDEESKQSLCQEGLNALEPIDVDEESRLTLGQITEARFELRHAMEAAGLIPLESIEDELSVLRGARFTLEALDSWAGEDGASVSSSSEVFYSPEEMRTYNCELEFDGVSDAQVYCRWGFPVVVDDSGAVTEEFGEGDGNADGVISESDCLAFSGSLEEILDGAPLVKENPCD